MKNVRTNFGLALVATLFAVHFFYAGVYLPLRGMPPIGIEVRPQLGIIKIWSVQPESPAADAGVLPGDILSSFNGHPVVTLNDYLIPEQLISRDVPAVLGVERDGRHLELGMNVRGTYYDSLSPLNRFALLFWTLVGALELALAFTLAFNRPHDAPALSAALFLAVLTTLNTQSAGFATAFRSLPLFLKVIIYPVPLLSLEILFFAFVFCANFPRPLSSKRIWWITSLPALAIYLFVALLNAPMNFGPRPELLFETGVGVYFDAVKLPMLFILCGYGVAAIVAIIKNYSRCDLVERRRIKLMLVGALIGLSSVVPAAIIHDLIYSDLISRSGLISIAFGLLRIFFLICFVYAVVKQRVFEIPVLLQRSGRYLLVQRGYLILLGLAGIAATLLFARFLRRAFPAEADYSVAIGATFGITLVWLGSVVHKRIQDRIDRAFFRSAYDAQHLLEEMAERSRRATTRGELVEILSDHISKALHPKSSAVLLEVPGGDLESPSADGVVPFRLRNSSPSLNALAVSGKPLEIQPHALDADDLRSLAPLQPEFLVPIIGRSEPLRGLLVLGPRLSEEPYSGDDLRLLRSAAAQAGVALENISLAEDIAQRLQAERMAAHELAIARQVQSKLLPGSVPVLQTLQCIGKCLQAKQVGGDFYDFIEYGEGKIALVLADIAGKGISAALLMASLQAHLRSHRLSSPKEMPAALASVNHHFRRSIEVGGFATLFFAFYDDSTGILSYANCGHAPAVVMRDDGRVQRLESTATVIGAFEDWQTDLEHVRLDEGDVFVLYSDGVTEAENEEGDLFGEARLLELLHGCKGLAAGQLVETIIGATLDFGRRNQLDDITLVVAKATPVSASRRANAAGQSSASA